MANRKKGDTGRAYIRLTRHDRNQIEEMLKKRASCRQIAKAIGRAPSTVSNEVERHRYVVAPKAPGGRQGARRPGGGMRDPRRVAEVLQRVQARVGVRLLEEAQC